MLCCLGSTRPVRDLIENSAATAYLGVLVILVGFLSFLAISDLQMKRRKREDMEAMVAATERLREQGCAQD